MMRILSCSLLAVTVWGGGAPAASAQVFTGSAPSASDPFPLQPGLVMVDLEHQGPGEFRARLLDQTGTVVEELAGTSGAFTGSRAVQIPRGEQYLLDVVATGEWRVRIRRFGEVAEEELETHPELERARAQGAAAADEQGILGWFGGGVLAGTVAGPVGAALVTVMAGREPPLPAGFETWTQAEDPVVSGAMEESYRASFRPRRQRAALRGGLIGTALLTFAVIKWTDFARPSGTGDPNGGGEPLQLVPIPRH